MACVKITTLFVFLTCLYGASEAKNVGRFWHVTDFHYDYTYTREDLSCNSRVSKHGKFGDYWCDSPWTLVQSAVDFMGKKTSELSNVDFAIWTGDTIAHVKNDQTDLDNNVLVIQNVTNALAKALPRIPVYASLGNHDFHPDGQAPIKEDEFYRKVGDLWKDWMRNQSLVDQFEDGGFYSKALPGAPNIRLLALNTNLYYTANKLTPEIDDPAGQFAWMEAELQDAMDKNQKVLVTGHVPPGLLIPDLVEWYHPKHKTRFVEILFQFSEIIVAAHFGHDHEDGFKIIQNNDGSKSIAHYSAPSVTPWRYKFKTATGYQTGDPHNPAVRLIEYDRDTGVQLDYIQYFINLTDSNTAGQANWAKLYSFKEAYDVQDMSVTSLRKIFDRMKNGEGREYSDKFCRFHYSSKYEKHCSDLSRGEIYCGGLIHDVDKAKACVKSYLDILGANGSNSLTLKFTTIFLSIVMTFYKSCCC